MSLPINACIKLSSSPPPPLPNASPPPLSQWSGWRRSTLAAAMAAAAAAAIVAIEAPIAISAETGGAVAAAAAERWSEKRKCPAWRANSLENIMPENLPRPPRHRRSDGLAAYRDAPALGGAAQLRRYSSGCYSL